MTRSDRLTRARAIVDRWLGRFLIALMALAVANVLWQVFTRFVLGDPSSFTEELARYLLIWIGLLGGAYATGRRIHPAIELLPAALSLGGRRRQRWAVEATVAVFALGVMVAGGLRLVTLTLSLGQTSAALGIPLGYVYLVLPLSGVLIFGYAIDAALNGPSGAADPPSAVARSP